MANWKALCAELLAELHAYKIGHPSHDTDLVDRARAALAAEPQGDVPTDEELLDVADLLDAWNAQADALNSWDQLGLDEIICWAQRQALARWGRHSQPVVKESLTVQQDRPASPQPIPVAERLPRPEDCDAEGRCWWYGEGEDMVGWTHQDSEGLSYYRATHWLPTHSLPLPSGEG